MGHTSYGTKSEAGDTQDHDHAVTAPKQTNHGFPQGLDSCSIQLFLPPFLK